LEHINNMSETKVKEREMRTTYHCENCKVKFPVEDERFGMCRECNEGCGFCYECEKKDEKISKLESSNEKILNKLKSLQKWMDDFPKHAEISLPYHIKGELRDQSRLIKIIINKAEGK